jgi:cell division protein FtsB
MGGVGEMKDDRTNPKKESDRTDNKTSKRRWARKSPWIWVAGLAILASGATVYAVPVLDRLEEQHTEIAQFSADLEVLEAENAELEDRLSLLHRPSEIERLARERLGYVREGETAFVVVSPREGPSDSSEEELAQETGVLVEAPWYEQWWSYVTGSDLTEES